MSDEFVKDEIADGLSDLSSDDSVVASPLRHVDEYVDGQYGLGAVLLTRMGHVQGEGLGARSQGIVEPVETAVRSKYTGLGRIPSDDFTKEPEPTLSPEVVELDAVHDALAVKRQLRQVALDAKTALFTPNMDINLYFDQFQDWWSTDLSSVLETAGAALLAREIETSDPASPDLLSNLSMALRLLVVKPSVWAQIATSKWVPAAVDSFGWAGLLKISKGRGFLANEQFENTIAGSVPISLADSDLIGDCIELLSANARQILIKRTRDWLVSDLKGTPLIASTEYVSLAEDIAGLTNLDTVLAPLVAGWASRIDPIKPEDWTNLTKWCGAVSPNTMAQILNDNVLLRWATLVPEAASQMGSQWWYAWKGALPIELRHHPIVLDWTNYALGLINAYLDGVEPQFGPPKPTERKAGTRSTFKDVVQQFCVTHKIPFTPLPLTIRGVYAQINDDVLYLDIRGSWTPVSLEDLK